jgi:hypothetical protein
MVELPPDLDRLGTALTSAAARARAARVQRAERRRRLLGCLAAGLVVFAAMPASHLGRADQPGTGLEALTGAPAEAAVFCDAPHGSVELSNDCIPRPAEPPHPPTPAR